MERDRTLVHLIAGLACASAAGIAPADDFFSISGIPDFDQRRQGLPGDGSMYCAPTAASNMIRFMATHGLPSLRNCVLDPGNLILANDWYTGITLRIESMGSFMDTDATNGTNGDGYTNGVIDYVDAVSNVPLIELSYDKSENFPSPGLMLAWMKAGALVGLCYGRYTNPYGTDKSRDGGHCVTMNQVRLTQTALPNPFDLPWMPQSYNDFEIGYRDPAADEGSSDPDRLTKQSPYATTVRDTSADYADFDGTTTTLYGIGSKPTDPLSEYAYIDGYRVLLPLIALTNVKTTGGFHLHSALTKDSTGDYQQRLGGFDLNFMADPGGDLAFDPIAPAFVHTIPNSNTIYQNEFMSDTGRPLNTTRSRIIGLEYGDIDQDLFVLQTDRVAVLGRNNRWKVARLFTFMPEAEVFDVKHNHLIIESGGTLRIFNSDLSFVAQSAFRSLVGSGRMFLRIDPYSGDLYAMRRGLPAVQRFEVTDSGFKYVGGYDLSAVGRPVNFDFGKRYMFVSDGTKLYQYTANGRLTKGSPFSGAPAGSMLKFARSYTNYSPDRYPLPAWRDLDDPGVPLK